MTINIDKEELVKLINEVRTWSGKNPSIYITPHTFLNIDSKEFLSDELIGGELFGVNVKSVSDFFSKLGNYSENIMLE